MNLLASVLLCAILVAVVIVVLGLRRGSSSPPPGLRRGSSSPPGPRRGSSSPPGPRRGSSSPPPIPPPASGGNVCVQQADLDLEGGNLDSPGAGSLEDCCSLCSAHPQCECAVFFGQVCYMKASCDQTYENPQRVAVAPNKPPGWHFPHPHPPPPPPPDNCGKPPPPPRWPSACGGAAVTDPAYVNFRVAPCSIVVHPDVKKERAAKFPDFDPKSHMLVRISWIAPLDEGTQTVTASHAASGWRQRSDWDRKNVYFQGGWCMSPTVSTLVLSLPRGDLVVSVGPAGSGPPTHCYPVRIPAAGTPGKDGPDTDGLYMIGDIQPTITEKSQYMTPCSIALQLQAFDKWKGSVCAVAYGGDNGYGAIGRWYDGGIGHPVEFLGRLCISVIGNHDYENNGNPNFCSDYANTNAIWNQPFFGQDAYNFRYDPSTYRDAKNNGKINREWTFGVYPIGRVAVLCTDNGMTAQEYMNMVQEGGWTADSIAEEILAHGCDTVMVYGHFDGGWAGCYVGAPYGDTVGDTFNFFKGALAAHPSLKWFYIQNHSHVNTVQGADGYTAGGNGQGTACTTSFGCPSVCPTIVTQATDAALAGGLRVHLGGVGVTLGTEDACKGIAPRGGGAVSPHPYTEETPGALRRQSLIAERGDPSSVLSRGSSRAPVSLWDIASPAELSSPLGSHNEATSPLCEGGIRDAATRYGVPSGSPAVDAARAYASAGRFRGGYPSCSALLDGGWSSAESLPHLVAGGQCWAEGDESGPVDLCERTIREGCVHEGVAVGEATCALQATQSCRCP